MMEFYEWINQTRQSRWKKMNARKVEMWYEDLIKENCTIEAARFDMKNWIWKTHKVIEFLYFHRKKL